MIENARTLITEVSYFKNAIINQIKTPDEGSKKNILLKNTELSGHLATAFLRFHEG